MPTSHRPSRPTRPVSRWITIRVHVKNIAKGKNPKVTRMQFTVGKDKHVYVMMKGGKARKPTVAELAALERSLTSR